MGVMTRILLTQAQKLGGKFILGVPRGVPPVSETLSQLSVLYWKSIFIHFLEESGTVPECSHVFGHWLQPVMLNRVNTMILAGSPGHFLLERLREM